MSRSWRDGGEGLKIRKKTEHMVLNAEDAGEDVLLVDEKNEKDLQILWLS